MGDCSEKKVLFMEKILFKSHKIISNHRALRKNRVDTHGAPVFAPNYSASDLAVKMCSNSNKHFMYIGFLWFLAL